MKRVLAVDLGGTKIATAVVDETGRTAARARISTEGGRAPEQIVELTRAGLAEYPDVCAAGVIVPGIYFAGRGEVWAPNVFGSGRFPLGEFLEARLRLPVVIDSDRSGYVLGEQWLGAARGLGDVIYLAVGTGIGAGIIAGGRLLRGHGGVAGAVGWFALTPNRKELYGRIGCLEAEAAGPSVARRLGVTDTEQAAEAARRGDPLALEAFSEVAGWLAMGIANLISAFNPQMMVLGGGLMQAADLLLEQIRSRVVLWAQPTACDACRIELSRLGEDAGLLGAARLALPSNE